jgi:benzoyl-CoA reductase/2-hydroxyglutaryl-CoA dehydratase subunit BcrC/BadD/HgdB
VRGGVMPSHVVLLFDLLQSDGTDVWAYDAARTRDLFETLVTRGQRSASVDDVRDAIARANRARAALRRLLALRRGTPRVSGTEVLPLLGAFWRLAPDDYTALASDAADVLAQHPPLHGPRVLLAGAPVDGPALHAVIESHGAVVVAEPGPWGSDAAGEDVPLSEDPFIGVAQRYRQAIGPRTPLVSLQQRLRDLADDVDAVVVLLPSDDAVFGWDYPGLRAWLDARQLPHLCLFGDASVPPGPAEHERIAALVVSASHRIGARHG